MGGRSANNIFRRIHARSRLLAAAAIVVALTLPGLVPGPERSRPVPEKVQAKLAKEEARIAKYGRPGPPFDKPKEALLHYLYKRSPDKKSPLSYSRYAKAREHAEAMPSHSSGVATRGPGASGPWSWLGPGNIGGRTRGLLVHPTIPTTMYAGGVAGGVWRTTNGGASWAPLTDTMANLAISALTFDPSNPNTIYAGTGEGFFNADAVRGAGIFKSTDGGATWTNIGGTGTSADFHFVNDIVVSNLDPQRVYAGTRTGIFRSTNGGTSFTKVFTPTQTDGCTDLVKRTDTATDVILASCGNGQQSAIVRNTDAGGAGTWSQVLSDPGQGRGSLAVAPSNQSVIYALTASINPGNYANGLHKVFRSTDGGATWSTRVSNASPTKLNTLLLTNPVIATLTECGFGASNFFNQGWYDNVIAVDPVNADRVWTGGIDLFRSDDGGANWGLASHWWANTATPEYAHADQHAIVFHPQYNGTTNRTVFFGNDGGIFRSDDATDAVATGPAATCNSTNGDVSFTELNNNYGVTQFYDGAVYPGGATYFGGTQDNGTVRGMDATGAEAWTTLLGGDGGYVAVDPNNTNVLYAENFNLSIQKSTNGGTSFANATTGISTSDSFLFINPFIMDPNNAQNLWTGGNIPWRTTNGAASWVQAGASFGARTSAWAVAPGNSNSVVAGTEIGKIHRNTSALTANAGTTWTSVTPRSGFVSSVAFDPNDANTVYATYSTFGGQHVWKSTNGGASFTSIDGSGGSALPDIPVHSLVVHPDNSNRLYIGTDLGVFYSADGGATWATENTGFPNTVTEVLKLQTIGGIRRIWAFTHGRGVFKVDTPGSGGGQPSLSISNATVNEGNAGTTNATFTVTMTGTTTQTVTVNFATANGTATAPGDYTSATGTLTFQPADTTMTINVAVNGDTTVEPNETFTVNLSNATNATIATGTGTGTITNDDTGGGQATLNVGDAPAVTEGGNLVFTVSVTNPHPNPITFTAATSSGSATAGADFTAVNQQFTIPGNGTSVNVTVPTIDDTADEADTETVFLNISAPSSNATIGDGQGVGNIQDNDATGETLTEVLTVFGKGSIVVDGVGSCTSSTRNGTRCIVENIPQGFVLSLEAAKVSRRWKFKFWGGDCAPVGSFPFCDVTMGVSSETSALFKKKN